jgi:hypothetical protein
VDWIFSIRLTGDINIAEEGTEKYGRKTLTAKRLRSFDLGALIK